MRVLVPKLAIVNLVATADLRKPVDLSKLPRVDGFAYDRRIYYCAYLKDTVTNGKVSIFATGKMIAFGSKSFGKAKHDLEYATRRLEMLGCIPRTKILPKIKNIVATASVPFGVNLEQLSRLPHVIYEPEQFPAAICYSDKLEGASMLIFASGKVVFSGLKSMKMLNVAKGVLLDFEIPVLNQPQCHGHATPL